MHTNVSYIKQIFYHGRLGHHATHPVALGGSVERDNVQEFVAREFQVKEGPVLETLVEQVSQRIQINRLCQLNTRGFINPI